MAAGARAAGARRAILILVGDGSVPISNRSSAFAARHSGKPSGATEREHLHGRVLWDLRLQRAVLGGERLAQLLRKRNEKSVGCREISPQGPRALSQGQAGEELDRQVAQVEYRGRRALLRHLSAMRLPTKDREDLEHDQVRRSELALAAHKRLDLARYANAQKEVDDP